MVDSINQFIPDDSRADPVNYPADLNKDKIFTTGQDFFTIPVVNLKVSEPYSFNFQWVFPDGEVSPWSDALTLTTAGYVSELTKPAVTVTPSSLGYIVSYTPQTDKNFDFAVIEEVVSTSNTAPTTGYQQVLATSANPAEVTVGDVLKRWVRIKLIDKISGSSPYSDPVAVTPVDPVAAATDAIAPDPIQSATAVGIADSSDSSGISGIINISVVNAAATVPADFNGYIVKIIRQSDNKEWYQTFFSKTYLSTLSVKLGIVVGQSYTLSVSTTDGRNQSVFVAITGNPISVSDTRTNTSTISGSLSFSATDSILTVSWGLSTDANVDSYFIELTSNEDTTFTNVLQSAYSRGTTVSFGGLQPNTTYRVRVKTKYAGANGPLSTSSVTGTFTLNASGAISDGVAPTTNPTPTVKSLFKAFALYWDEIVNNDLVTYEVYVKTVNATNIVSPENKVMEINGTFAVINALADGTGVQYPAESNPTSSTDYYFAIRAKDNDGISSGSVVAVGPFTASRTGQFDIATNAIYANHITAGQINADKMVTDLLFAEKTINVGETTSLNRVRLDGTTATLTDYPSGSYQAKGRIFIGAGNYYSSGTSFYADNTGRLSIGDKLRFDTSGNLTINGSGTFTGLLTTGSGSQIIKVGTGANGSNNGLYIQQGNQYIYTDGTFSFGNGSLTWNGTNLNVSGTMIVKGNSELQGDLKLVSPGTFYIGDNKEIGGLGDKIIINSGGIAAYASMEGSPRFELAKNGTGKIGGWTIGNSTLTGGTLTLNSSGTVYSTGTATGWIGSNVDTSSTFSSGKISIYANESTTVWAFTSTDAGIRAYNNTNETYLTPNGIRINAITSELGVGAGGFSITHTAGDYDVHFNLTGASNVGTQTGRYIMFDHWKSGSGQRDKDNIMRTFDTAMSGIRSIKMYTDGRMYLGETQYFSTDQVTTPSSGLGENGDLFFSTA